MVAGEAEDRFRPGSQNVIYHLPSGCDMSVYALALSASRRISAVRQEKENNIRIRTKTNNKKRKKNN